MAEEKLCLYKKNTPYSSSHRHQNVKTKVCKTFIKFRRKYFLASTTDSPQDIQQKQSKNSYTCTENKTEKLKERTRSQPRTHSRKSNPRATEEKITNVP